MKKDKEKIAQEVSQKMKEMNEVERIEDLLKDNKIEFELNETKYRVRKPIYREREQARKSKNVKYLELLNDDTYMLKDQLIDIYRKKGIDINKMEAKIVNLQNEIEKLQVRLATSSDQKSIDLLKNYYPGAKDDNQ